MLTRESNARRLAGEGASGIRFFGNRLRQLEKGAAQDRKMLAVFSRLLKTFGLKARLTYVVYFDTTMRKFLLQFHACFQCLNKNCIR